MRCLRLVALVSAALLTSARVNFQGPECMRSTPLSRTCFGERAAELSIDAARPGHCVLGLDAASDAACRRSLLVDTYSNIRAVIPGNAAVVDLMRNLLATDEALPLPFPVNFVPLDTEGAGALLRHPDGAPLPLAATAPRGSPSSKVFVALDKAALDTFSGGEAKYQTGAYTEMTRYKWRLAARLLEEDSPGAGPPPALLVSDPDIVFFRNPLPYLSRLPACDVSFQSELTSVARLYNPLVKSAASSSISTVLLSGFNTAVDSMWGGMLNTGFMLLRPSNTTKSLISQVLRYYDASADFQDTWVNPLTRKQRSVDDQTLLTELMSTVFYVDGAEGGPRASIQANHDAARRAMQSGRCVKLVKRPTADLEALFADAAARVDGAGQGTSDKAQLSDAFSSRRSMPGLHVPAVQAVVHSLPPSLSMWLLSPPLFPTRVVLDKTELCQTLAEPPFLIHYNWLKTTQEKIAEMKYNCHWFLDLQGGGEGAANATQAA